MKFGMLLDIVTLLPSMAVYVGIVYQ